MRVMHVALALAVLVHGLHVVFGVLLREVVVVESVLALEPICLVVRAVRLLVTDLVLGLRHVIVEMAVGMLVAMLAVHVADLATVEGLVARLVEWLLHDEASRHVVVVTVLGDLVAMTMVFVRELFNADAALIVHRDGLLEVVVGNVALLSCVVVALTVGAVFVLEVRAVVGAGLRVVEGVVNSMLVEVNWLHVVLVIIVMVQLWMCLVILVVGDLSMVVFSISLMWAFIILMSFPLMARTIFLHKVRLSHVVLPIVMCHIKRLIVARIVL